MLAIGGKDCLSYKIHVRDLVLHYQQLCTRYHLTIMIIFRVNSHQYSYKLIDKVAVSYSPSQYCWLQHVTLKVIIILTLTVMSINNMMIEYGGMVLCHQSLCTVSCVYS